MKKAKIKIENNDTLKSLQGFLGKLLTTKVVDALLVPRRLPGGDGFVQTLISDSAKMQEVNPLAPTMPVQSATILSELSTGDFKGRIGAVVKPCELRAGVELAKFLQVNLSQMVTISIDCPGTVEVRDFAQLSSSERDDAVRALSSGFSKDAGALPGGVILREACRICEYPVPLNADIAIELLGCEPGKFSVAVKDSLEKEIAEKLSLQFDNDENPARKTAVDAFISAKKELRAKHLDEMKGLINGLDKCMEVFSTCIRCHNCMNACPICYCKECVFISPLFEHRAEQFLSWARRKGAIRMPGDTLIFHLTRLGHMATSCVGCGMCDSACPSRLPVSKLFNLVGKDLQEMFGYVPGRDAGEAPPVSVFKEEELKSESGTQ